MTMAAAFTVGSAVLGMGNKGSNVQLQATLELMDMVRSVHSRLDNIEAILGEVLVTVSQFPLVIQQELRNNNDLQRSEDIIGLANTISQRIELLQQRNQATKDDRELIAHLERMKTTRNTLFLRTDNVVPTIIRSLVIEISLLKALGRGQDEIEQTLESYDIRLRSAQNVNVEGSLAWMTERLMPIQVKNQEEISILVKNNFGIEEFRSGIFDWYVHNLISVKSKTVYEGCDARERKQPWPRTWCPHFKSTKSVIHGRKWRLGLRVTEITDLGGLLQVGARKIGPDVIKGGIPKATEHTKTDKIYEQPYVNNYDILQNDIKALNLRADQLQAIEVVLQLVAMARGLTASWDAETAVDVAKQTEAIEGDLTTNERVANVATKSAEVTRLLIETDKDREEAWRRIDASGKRLQAVMDQAKRNAWRGEVIALLNVGAASAGMYSALEAENAASQLRSAAEGIEAGSGMLPQDSLVEPEAPAVAKGDLPADAVAEEPVAPAPVDAQNPWADWPSNWTLLENRKKMGFVRLWLREMENKPAKSYDIVPDPYTTTEMIGFKILSALDTMGPTAADRFHGNGERPIEIIANAIQDGLISGPDGMAQTLISAALTPSSMKDGTLESISFQNEIRAKTNSILGDFTLRRMMSPDNTVKSRIEEFIKAHEIEVLCRKNGCIQAR